MCSRNTSLPDGNSYFLSHTRSLIEISIGRTLWTHALRWLASAVNLCFSLPALFRPHSPCFCRSWFWCQWELFSGLGEVEHHGRKWEPANVHVAPWNCSFLLLFPFHLFNFFLFWNGSIIFAKIKKKNRDFRNPWKSVCLSRVCDEPLYTNPLGPAFGSWANAHFT